MRIGILEVGKASAFARMSQHFLAAGHAPLSRPLLSATELVPLQLDALLLEDTACYDSLAICRKLRGLGSRAAIVILGQDFDAERAKVAFAEGVDDYLVAPVDAHTVLTHLQILALRKDVLFAPGDLRLGAVRIDARGRVWVGEALQRVPSKEVALLRCLAAMRDGRDEQLGPTPLKLPTRGLHATFQLDVRRGCRQD